MKDEIAISYMSGFFDGEGSVTIQGNVRVRIRGCFVPGILEQYRDTWGGTLTQYRRYKPNHRDCIEWWITGPKAVRMLIDMLPYLREKKPQALVAIEFQNFVSKTPKGGIGRRGRTEEEKATMQDMRRRISSLKHASHFYV